MTHKRLATLVALAASLSPITSSFFWASPAFAQSPVPAVGAAMHAAPVSIRHSKSAVPLPKTRKLNHNFPGSVSIKSHKKNAKASRAAAKKKKTEKPPAPPQTFVNDLSTRTIAPGVVHKVHRGAMYINVLDIDLRHANVVVKPVLAGTAFNTLDEVKDQAQKVNAIAAVNGNYFKRDGTPLGTLVIDGEWVTGPLYDRTCMGITDDGQVLVERVTLHGDLETSNPEARSIWINNINQPRRHGCHIIAYTRRWGDSVHMDYEGSLVAVDGGGRVIAKSGNYMAIPPGGFVLSDSKVSPLNHLNVGDDVHLSWHVGPSDWSHVVHAVSGGPVLIRDGKLFVDCQSENFRKSWTSNSIHARTAVGVTADRHLLLATIEGPHTLWDVAKFLQKLGAVDAMNLDGGGSTTMVIGGTTVTRNPSHFQRRVASSLVVLARGPHTQAPGVTIYRGDTPYFQPAAHTNLTDFSAPAVPAGNADLQQSSSQSRLPSDSQSQLLPSTEFPMKNSYELVDVAPPPTVAQGEDNGDTRLDAGARILQSHAVVPDTGLPGKGRFGWMKKLNPLGW